jgi:hypothetical protein
MEVNMRIGNMLSNIAYGISGTKVCWVRDGSAVSIMAILPESNRMANREQSIRLAEKAERIAEREASRIGVVIKTGAFMGGEGNGHIQATGVAEIPWAPDIEHKLSLVGIHEG